MQAAVYHGPRDIGVEDVPMPEIADDELLVRIKACGICGSDLQQRDPLEAVIGLTDGPKPIGRFEVNGAVRTWRPILTIFQVITPG